MFRVEDFGTLLRYVREAPNIEECIDGNTPSTLIIHGTNDERVPYSRTENILCPRFAEYGVDYEIMPIEGAGHFPFINEEELGLVRPKINEWLDHLPGTNGDNGLTGRISNRVSDYFSRRLRELYI